MLCYRYHATRNEWKNLWKTSARLIKNDFILKLRWSICGLLLVMVIAGCSTEQNHSGKLDSNLLKTKRYEESQRKKRIEYIAMIDTTYACKMIRNYPDSLVLGGDIRYRELLNGYDSCVLEIIDALFYDYRRTGEEKYIMMIDSISKYSDGYISEFLEENIGKLFSKSPINLIKYLSRKKEEDKIFQRTIWYLQSLHDYEYYENEKEDVARTIDSCLKILSKHDATWLKKIVRRAKLNTK